MDITEIIDNNYSISYDADTVTIKCTGYFRLRGTEEYAPMLELLYAVADHGLPELNMDVTGLEFLNSSGINMLSKFVLRLRKGAPVKLTIHASETYPWQKKSLRNFQKLQPGTDIQYS